MNTFIKIKHLPLSIPFMGLALLFLTACGSGKSQEGETAADDTDSGITELSAEQITANELELGQPLQYEFSRIVTASGYLEPLPQNRHTLTTVMGGTIRDLHLLPGDRVQRGALLFRIHNPDLLQIQEDYLTASAALKYLQDDYERQKMLASGNISAQKVFLKAESDFLATKARVQALEAKLDMLHINRESLQEGKMLSSVAVTAPISGFITRVDGSNGRFVQPDSRILEIVETSPLLLSLQVFEKDIAHVREGQHVTFRIPEVTGEIFEATVQKTGKSLDDNRTVNIHALFTPAAALRLIPGMFVSADIITESFTAMALPLGAVISGEDHSFVLVKTNPEQGSPAGGWKLAKITVTTGYQDEKMVEIKPGGNLKLSDQVVVSGAFSVAN